MKTVLLFLLVGAAGAFAQNATLVPAPAQPVNYVEAYLGSSPAASAQPSPNPAQPSFRPMTPAQIEAEQLRKAGREEDARAVELRATIDAASARQEELLARQEKELQALREQTDALIIQQRQAEQRRLSEQK